MRTKIGLAAATAAFVLAAAAASIAAEIDDGIKDGTHGYTPNITYAMGSAPIVC